MRRSLPVWVSVLGLPAAFACNLILGNETPGVARDGNGASDSSVSSSSGTAQNDADSPADDAEADAAPAERPASRLVFVNGIPPGRECTPNACLADSVLAYVLREDLEDSTWNAPNATNPGFAANVASSAVFFVSGRLYVLGGLFANQGYADGDYAAVSAEIVNDVVQKWEEAEPLPYYSKSRCAARVDETMNPATVDVLCGVPADSVTGSENVVAFYSDVRALGPTSWTRDFSGPPLANGVVYSTPDYMAGFPKQQQMGMKGITWSRDGEFSEQSGTGLPALTDACAASFDGHSYVVVAEPDATRTFVQQRDGTWSVLNELTLPARGLQDLTCTATKRGLYLAANINGAQSTSGSTLFRALASSSGSGIVQGWQRLDHAPPVHDPGAVLVAIPLSAGDAGD